MYKWRSDVVVSALDFRSVGLWFDAQSLPSCCFLRQVTLPHIVSLHPGVEMGIIMIILDTPLLLPRRYNGHSLVTDNSPLLTPRYLRTPHHCGHASIARTPIYYEQHRFLNKPGLIAQLGRCSGIVRSWAGILVNLEFCCCSSFQLLRLTSLL